ncbi:MAG: alpha/beta fold hydrolase [Deltaproteobacteria bacterium]|nr:alpha/beta fold hydrolase [Deltaproteobacteria bacterium]
MSVAVQRFRVRAGGDTELACARFGRGEPLLYLHALGYSKEHAVAAADGLGAAFDCVAFDQRGHGETRGGGATPGVELDAMADDACAVLDHAGWSRAIVGGTSMGAAVALRVALRHPRRVAVLVQDLPAFGPRSPRGAERSARIAEALEIGDLDEGARRATAGLSGKRAEALARELLGQWRHFEAAELGPKLAAAFRGTVTWNVLDDWPDGLARIRVTTHLIALEGDASHPWEVAQTMAAHIPGARLVRRVPTLDPKKSFAQWVALLR